MKISKKLIGIGVASFGALASIGGAFALYKQAAENTGFGISAGAYAGSGGTVTYKINGVTNASDVAPQYLTDGGANGGTGLSTTYTQVEYSMALSATYAAGANAQDFVVGNLGISLTNVPEVYRGKLAVWAVVDNYVASSLGEHHYRTSLMPNAEDFAITAEDGHQSFSSNHDIAVSSAGTQVLHIYLKYNLAGIDTLTQNEASLGYTLNVTWGQPVSFNPAYVKGDANQWTADDGYSMAPNINKAYSEGWEWIYNNLPGTIGETKCFIRENETDKWSATNFPCESAKSYNVTWSGVHGAAANYAEVA